MPGTTKFPSTFGDALDAKTLGNPSKDMAPEVNLSRGEMSTGGFRASGGERSAPSSMSNANCKSPGLFKERKGNESP